MAVPRLFPSLALVGLMLAGGNTCALAQDAGPHGGARTYYESLAMQTPEASAKGFLAAYRAGDYQTVYFHLSPAAQEGFTEAIGTFAFDRLLRGLDDLDLPGSRFFALDDDAADEVIYDMSLVFDDVLHAGDRLGKLAFTIGAEAKLVAVRADEDSARFTLAKDKGQAELTLDLVRIASGRWKLDRVSWEGSGPAKPWDSGQDGLGSSTP